MPARARQDITPGHDAQATRPQTTRLREPALWTRSETRGAAEVQRILVTCCASAAGPCAAFCRAACHCLTLHPPGAG